MRKYGFKRALALALSLVMMLSLLPATVLAGDESIAVNFKEATVTTSDDTSNVAEEKCCGTGWKTIGNESSLAGKMNRLFNIAGSKKVLQIAIRVGGAAVKTWIEDSAAKWTIEVDMKTTEEKYYDVSVDYAGVSNGSAWYVYVNDKYAGFVNCYKSGTAVTNATLSNAKLNTVKITPDSNGKAKVMFAYAGAGNTAKEEGYGRAYINKLTLTPNAEFKELQKEDLEIVCDVPEIIYTGDAEKEISACVKANGEILHINGLTSSKNADSENSLSVEVTENANNAVSLTPKNAYGIYYYPTGGNGKHTEFDGVYKGTIKPLALGTATIKISGEYNNVPFEKEIDVEVKKPPKLDRAVLSAEDVVLPVNQTTKTLLSLVRDDGEPYSGEYSVEYAVEDDEIAEVDENGIITAKAIGETSVTAKVKALDGTEITCEGTVDITVTEPPEKKTITLEFSNKTISGNYDKNGATTADKYISAQKWTYSADNWLPVLSETTSGKTNVVGANGVRLEMTGDANWATLSETERIKRQFTVQLKDFIAPGYYNVKFTAMKHKTAGKMFVYVGGQYAGAYEAFEQDASDKPGEEVVLNTVYLSGKPKIMLVRGEKTGGAYATFHKVCLEPVDVEELSYSGINHDVPENLYIGDTADIRIAARLNDGSEMHYNGYNADASVNSLNEIVLSSEKEAATLSEVKLDDGIITAKLTGAEEGSALLRVSGKYNGKDFSDDISISIKKAPALKDVEISFGKNPIPQTRDTKASLKIIREDGEEYAGEYTAVYKSSDTDVAEVDENGCITAKKVGSTQISVEVTDSYGSKATGEATLIVASKPVLSELFGYAENSSLLVGEETALNISGKTDDGYDADLSSFEFSYESLNSDIAEISKEGRITAKTDGKARIKVKTLNENDEEISVIVNVTVYKEKPELMIDFTQTVTANAAPYLMPTVTPGYEIIADRTTSNPLWARYTFNEIGKNLLYVPTTNKATAMGQAAWPLEKHGNSVSFVFEVDIPFESDYQIEFSGGKGDNGGFHTMYIDKEYLGDYTFWHEISEKKVGPVVQFNTVHLTAGKHTFQIHLKESGTNYTSRAILNSLTFRPVSGNISLSRIDAGEVPEIMAVGEIFDGEAKVYMSDGSRRHFSDMKYDGSAETVNTFTAESSAGLLLDFADYKVGTGTDKRAIKLTAKTAGESEKLILTAKVGDKTEIKEYTIKVEEDPIKTAGGTTEAEEIFVGDTTLLVPVTELASGRKLPNNGSATSVFSSDSDCVDVDSESGRLTALKIGTAKIKVETTFNGETETGYFNVEILPEGMTEIKISAGGSQHIRLSGIENDTVPLYVQAISNLGRELDISDAEITAMAENPEIAKIDSSLNITPVSEGEAYFAVTVKLDGRERTVSHPLTVSRAKSGSTYYTSEKLEAVRENVKLYDWAKSAMETNMDGADFYLANFDRIYDLIHSEGLPRIRAIGIEADPNKAVCKYCGTNLLAEHGTYPWKHDPLNRPWQIQCPDCKRLFPSNDFGGFYKLGLNEYGEFDHQRALDAHHRLVKHGSADAVCTCTAPVAETQTDRTPEWYDYYGYGDENGFLYNKLYADDDPEDIAYFREGEKLETWGVDDGFGYIPRKEDGTPYLIEGRNNVMTPERHTYIGEYLFHALWRRGMATDTNGGMVIRAVQVLTNAYYYTGDVKYGRALAVLTDRIADFYEEFDMTRYEYEPWRSSDTCQGKLLNHIWENSNASSFARAYDIVYDLYDDPWVLDYIKEKGKTLKFRDAKETPSQIRTHIEDGILRGGLTGLTGENAARKGRALIGGNFGYPQATNSVLAVVLDTYPETQKWLDYLMASGWSNAANSLGGGINERLVDVVDRDGHGNEGSAYNNAWHTSLIGIAETLTGYGYTAADLYNNPKFVRMFYATPSLISGYYTPQIGDSASTLAKTHWMSEEVAIAGWQHLEDSLFAKILYYLNGNKAKGLHYGIDVKNPESLASEVQKVIDAEGEFEITSNMMTGFGFALLHDGGDYTDVASSTAKNTQRNVWMYFGTAEGHGHRDTLNLGMTAYGLNFMPDNGYPEETGMQPNRVQWVDSTLAHNTVMVNEKGGGNNNTTRSKSKHFDDDGMVQLMDVDAPEAYEGITDTYRRSVMMIKVDDEISYAVDFFRILGGNDHLYSFHASSDEIAETVGLTMTPQLNDDGTDYYGTYVGRKVEYTDPVTKEVKIFDPEGATEDPYSPQEWSYTTVFPRGYTWLDKVDRDLDPSEKFEIDFKIKDFNKAIKDSSGLHLRMTMLDGGNRDGREVSVATANGYPPNKADNKNIPFLRYVLVKHSAKDENADLDTTFTTVFEPYRSARYIKSVDELVMTPVRGRETESDSSKALRIEHTSGRIDYIFYATNNAVTYETEIDGGEKLSFSGFAGVYTVQNGENTYKYLHDGTILGESTGAAASIEGIVDGFTDDLLFDNYITVTPGRTLSEAEVADTVGRYVFIDNGNNALNGSYKIESAEYDGKKLTLGIGLVSLVKSYVDSMDFGKGYVFNIAIGQTARIPLTYSEDSSPILTSVPEGVTVSAGSSVSAAVSASSPLEGVTLSYRADTLPRGASFDTEKGVLTWKPDKSQVGEHHVAITAVDNFGRETTAHFTVTVYGSTTGSTSSDKTDENGKTETPSTDSSAGGGGGGGGGAAPDTETAPDDTENTGETGANDGDNAPDASGETESLRFTDLANHAWAADAINTLADDGVIKGTTATTYSPANNITRADFALLLVRAFDLTSDNTENFADVSASDYFAQELAVARNTGIVNGIGENKYAPRNSITRQDMMVIVYRALQKLNVGFGIYDEPQYPDFDTVADYAKDTVSALISAGLVNGKSGRIAPADYTTRAEVAVMIKRILDFTKQ